MQDDHREAQRQVYRQTSMGEKTFIPAKPKIDIYGSERIFRVCAYCRVSTDNDAQLSSFELQQAHYQQLMGSHPIWNLKQIYADEGISGTSLKKPDDFNAIIAACEAGEYDLIVTKSVSSFARNLVDCVSLVRKLKRQKPPVGVYFETDNLNTFSEDSELMLSFLATFAQEESVKKSESMNWSLRQRFRDGKLLTPALLGYERPRDVTGRYIKYAKLEIIESEAEIVRFIFNSFLAGKSTKEIAAFLTDIQCPTKTGNTEWNEGSNNIDRRAVSMNARHELIVYLEQERNKVNTQFPKYEETTEELFKRVYAFFDVDFEELADNRVYRCFLSSFREIICFAFETDVPKAYLRCFFKSLNSEIVVGYLGNCAKSRAKDIRMVMDRFLNFFVATWQGYNDDKNRVLEEIIGLIDYWM